MQVSQIVAVVFLYLAGFKLYFQWSRDKENNYIRGKRLFLKLDLVKGDQPNKQTKKLNGSRPPFFLCALERIAYLSLIKFRCRALYRGKP